MDFRKLFLLAFVGIFAAVFLSACSDDIEILHPHPIPITTCEPEITKTSDEVWNNQYYIDEDMSVRCRYCNKKWTANGNGCHQNKPCPDCRCECQPPVETTAIAYNCI